MEKCRKGGGRQLQRVLFKKERRKKTALGPRDSTVIVRETVPDKVVPCLENTWRMPSSPYKAQAQHGDR